jgi:hypothetical protein
MILCDSLLIMTSLKAGLWLLKRWSLSWRDKTINTHELFLTPSMPGVTALAIDKHHQHVHKKEILCLKH